ncbi:hypothetical protein AAG906_009788 [Vitis piasezkii]
MQLILVNLQGKNATKASKVLVFAPDNKTRYSIAALVKRRYVKKKHTQRIHKINQDPCEGNLDPETLYSSVATKQSLPLPAGEVENNTCQQPQRLSNPINSPPSFVPV